MTLREAWDRGQAGWPQRFVIAQFPNPPLIIAMLASLAARPLDGDAADVAVAVSRLGFAVFAYLEITDGANWFRRALGAAVAVWLVIGLRRVT